MEWHENFVVVDFVCHMKMRPRVLVIGGGISGLTVTNYPTISKFTLSNGRETSEVNRGRRCITERLYVTAGVYLQLDT
jgi:hypothetical protein